MASKVKINGNCKIVLSKNTLVGQIAVIMLNKFNNRLNHNIVDIPLDGYARAVDDASILHIDCGHMRRVQNSIRSTAKHSEFVSIKGTGSVVASLWSRLFDKKEKPSIFEYLEDLVDGDPKCDDGYALMCYIQDNFNTIDGNVFFDHPVEHNIAVAKKMIGL